MSILKVNFPELYERHLGRHSQYGINVVHILSLVGLYLGVLLILHWLFGWWVLPAILIPYFALLVWNLPVRVTGVLILGVAALVGLHWAVNVELLLPALEAVPVPWMALWVGIVVYLVCYKIQLQSHKWYPLERDMTEFNKKYPKGFALFVLLSLYEQPILLNYLTFDRKSWSSGISSEPDLVRDNPGFPPTRIQEQPPASV